MQTYWRPDKINGYLLFQMKKQITKAWVWKQASDGENDYKVEKSYQWVQLIKWKVNCSDFIEKKLR